MTENEIKTALRGARTPEELKRAWLAIVRECHPDKGGSVELCQLANSLYEELADGPFRFQAETEESPETEAEDGGFDAETLPEETREKAYRFAGTPGLVLEIVGTWLWITGDTRANKDALKENGFRWSPKKAAWYFHAEPYRKHSKRRFTLDEIRAMHGSARFGHARKEIA